jgi:hypothetical protein
MARTPGFVVPSSYSTEEELKADLQRRNEEAGYTSMDEFLSHSSDDDEILEHFGIKGMKWGQRKQQDSGSPSSSSAPAEKKKILTGKRVAVGLAVAAGTLYVGAMLAKRGSTTIPHIPTTPHTPSPFELRIQAGSAAHRNSMARIMNQRLTDKTWRDAAQMSRMARFSAGRKSVSDLEDVNARLMSFTDDALRRGGMR